MKSLSLYSWILNTIFVALAWVGYQHNLLQTAWVNDTTLITTSMLVIFGLTMVGIVRDTYKRETRNLIVYDYLGYVQITLGMTGTIFGFFVALSGVTPDAVGDVANIGPMVGKLLEGMSIAIWTTLTGIMFFLVVTTNVRLIEWRCQ
jgi:hypothetical protein